MTSLEESHTHIVSSMECATHDGCPIGSPAFSDTGILG